jgi:hypothetical protein
MAKILEEEAYTAHTDIREMVADSSVEGEV